MSDQERISPYNVNIISSKQVMRVKKKVNTWKELLQTIQDWKTTATKGLLSSIKIQLQFSHMGPLEPVAEIAVVVWDNHPLRLCWLTF